jgi:hypothetical protein
MDAEDNRPQSETGQNQNTTVSKSPDNGQLALAFYAAARAEIVQRLSMRETTLLAWITTAGVLVGWALKDGPSNDVKIAIAELLPIISLAFTFAISRHTIIIECIGTYLWEDLDGLLRQKELPKVAPCHWDRSTTLDRNAKNYLFLERITYLLLMAGPSAGCVWYLKVRLHLHSVGFEAALLSTIVVVGLSLFDVIRTMKHRGPEKKAAGRLSK